MSGRDGLDQEAVEAEEDGRVGHLGPGPVLLVDEATGKVAGDAEDGVGDQLRIAVADLAPGDASLTWRAASATAICSPLRRAGAKRSSVAANAK